MSVYGQPWTSFPRAKGLDVPPEILLKFLKILEGTGSVEDSAKLRPRRPSYYRNNSVNASYVRRIQRQADKRTASKRAGAERGPCDPPVHLRHVKRGSGSPQADGL